MPPDTLLKRRTLDPPGPPRFIAFSAAGDGTENQDVGQALLHPDDNTTLLCALADGQGGRSGARNAAEIAVQQALLDAVNERISGLYKPAFWTNTVRDADTVVLNASFAGYATLVCLCVAGNQIVGASSGDSSAFLLNDGHCIHLTQYQKKNPPIGSGGSEPVAFSQELGADWRLVVMSDGVWKYIGFEAVVAQTRLLSGEELIDTLHQRARRIAGGNLLDDFTIIVIEPARTDRG